MHRVRALEAGTGEELWSDLVDAPAVAIPSDLTRRGVDHMDFVAGGDPILGPGVSDRVVADRMEG